MSECKHGLEIGCAVCMRHKPTCTRWQGRITCRDHGVQYRPEPVGEPEAKRQRWWVYLPNHRSGFEWHLVTAPWAEGYCPTGEWPASEVPRTVVGPITKAIYNFKIPVYDWLGNVTYQVHAGVGHSWDAIDVSAKWWIRKEMSDLERPEHDVTVLIPDDV